MKANLNICGIPMGQIEIGENSIIGLLARGEFAEAMGKLKRMKGEIEALGAKVEIGTPEAGEGE